MYETLTQEMKLRNFSPRTMEMYLEYNRDFFRFTQKNPRDVSGKDIRNYLHHLIAKQQSSSTINLAHSALDLYYGTILRKKVASIPLQNEGQKIPPVAEPTEIQRMIELTSNPKYKLLMSLLYASGLPLTELINIKIEDINPTKRVLTLRTGTPDHVVILTKQVLTQIQQYLRDRPYESPYLFASQDGHITDRMVNAVIKQALEKARIRTSRFPHSQHHSFAHENIRTTRIFEPIIPVHLQTISSPQDHLAVNSAL